MKVIILGAGQVGSSVADNLASEANDITVVDQDEDLLRELGQVGSTYHTGSCRAPGCAAEAGGEDAEMILAVTAVMKPTWSPARLRIPVPYPHQDRTGARARVHRIPQLFAADAFPIDVLISPEQLVTEYIMRLIETRRTWVLDFANGLVRLVAVKAYWGPLVGNS